MNKERKNIIVVLNYNDWEETIRFFKMVENYSSVDLVVVVDNKSTDDSVIHLKKIENKKFVLVLAEENKGYAAGNNVGLRYIREKGYEGNIIISNPDIYFSDNNLKNILKPLKDKSIGITTGLITTNGRITSNFAWMLPDYWELISNQFLTLYKLKRKLHCTMYLDYPKNDENIFCNCVSGCFFCLTTYTLLQIGEFDERTFLFGEENILGFKIKQNGQKVCVVTKEKVEHNQHHSINKTTIIKGFNSESINLSSMLIYVKYYLKSTPFKVWLFDVVDHMAWFENRLVLLLMNLKNRLFS